MEIINGTKITESLFVAKIESIEVFIAQKQQMEQRCTRAIIRALMMFLAHLIGTALTGKGGEVGWLKLERFQLESGWFQTMTR